MKAYTHFVWLAAGLLLGYGASQWAGGPVRTIEAGDSRYDDFILCTGRVSVRPNVPTDGVWLLDYRTGKLMGTVVDRTLGKIIGFAEVDLVGEFGIQPRQNVHFLMTTGSITEGQAALYLAETSTGKMGVYTMGPRAGQGSGVSIRRHDMVFFRPPQPGDQPQGN